MKFILKDLTTVEYKDTECEKKKRNWNCGIFKGRIDIKYVLRRRCMGKYLKYT